MASMKKGACNVRGEKRIFCTYKKLSKYKNISSSDLTEECFSLQIVFSYPSDMNLTYCGPHLSH